MWNDEQIRYKNLWQYMPMRRNTVGRSPTFTASGSSLNEEERFKSWIFPDITPNPDTEKLMFSIAIGILVIETISNHGYQYNSKIYKQEEGGAIGLELVGVVANIYMCWWDKQLIDKVTENNMILELYKRYVDDSNMVVNDLRTDTTDKSVVEHISKIADSIDPCIKTTYDYCSNYEDGKVPMLDTKLWIGKSVNDEWKILHTHYMKDVSSRFLIHARSAHPSNMKINVLVNEGLRVLRNCSIHLGWEEGKKHLQYFVQRMQYSGYNQDTRAKVIHKILKNYDKKVENYALNQKMYRSRQEQYNERRKKKDLKKTNWYDQEKYDGVMFVDTTENGEYMNEIKKACKRNKLKIKVVEKMRKTIKKELQRSNPFRKENCSRKDCVLCEKNMDIDCRTRGCVYEIQCKECKKKYIGQTGRSIYERTKEHFKDWRDQKDGSILLEHSKKYHQNESFEVEISIKAKCFGEPATRLITEAVLIDELTNFETMNNKSEWSYVKLPHATITTDPMTL